MSDPGDVLVVGDLMVDVLVVHRGPVERGTDTAAQISLTGGGSAANAACWLAAQGERPRLLAARGDDVLGDLAVDLLARAGVEVVGPVLDGVATGTCVVLVDADGERTMLPDRAANDRLPVRSVLDAFDPTPGWVHLSGYAVLHEGSRAAGQAALSAGLAAGAVVSVDAASAAPLRAVGAEAFLRWIAGASVVFANDDEVEALGGVAAVLAAVDAVVVKHGAAGATWTDGHESETAAGLEVHVVDSTGAGDAFAAGWIAAVRRGATPAVALVDAVQAGATAVTRTGAQTPGAGIVTDRPAAVVFDFDGTIFDSETPIFQASAAALAEVGLTLTVEGWATVVGRGEDESFAALSAAVGADIDRTDFEARYAAQDRSWRDTLGALPGVVELIDALGAAGVPLGVASSSPEDWVEGHLARLGLRERFAVVATRDHVGGRAKPDPASYRFAVDALGAPPERSVAIEDSSPGIAAARAAGLAVVAVPSHITRHTDLSAADATVASMVDLSVESLASVLARRSALP